MRTVRKPHLAQGSTALPNAGVVCLLGLGLMHVGLALGVWLGEWARMGSLAVGFCLVLAAAVARNPTFLHRRGGLVAGTLAMAGGLLALSLLQGHEIYGPLFIPFFAIAVLLFLAGAACGDGKRSFGARIGGETALVVFAIGAWFAVGAFLRFANAETLDVGGREYGDSEMGAIAVGYLFMCTTVFAASLSLGLRGGAARLAMAVLAALAGFAVLSSTARGALLWGGIALVWVAFAYWRKRLSAKRVAAAIVTAGVIIVVGGMLYRGSEAARQRIEFLGTRFQNGVDQLAGRGADETTSLRRALWSRYLGSVADWAVAGEHSFKEYPHNQWLEIGVRFGVLGLPLLVLSFSSFGSALRLPWVNGLHGDPEVVTVVGMFVFGYLQSMTSLSLEMNRVLWFGAGYLVGLHRPWSICFGARDVSRQRA